MALQNAFANLSTEAKQDVIITLLTALQTELNQKLEAGQEVALNSATLAALESVTASISNFPSDYPDASTLAKLEAIRLILAGILTIKISDSDGTIADIIQVGTQVTSTDKGLITNAVIHGKTTAGGGSYVDVKVNPSGALTVDTGTDSALADLGTKLDNILTELNQKLEAGQQVALDAASLAALENITATVNFPSDFPDSAVLSKLEAIRVLLAGTLTVSGTVNLGTLNGAATSAKQDTGNTSLSSIDTKLTDNATATNQTTLNTAVGSQSDSAWSGTGNSSIISALKAIYNKVAGVLNIRALSSSTDSITTVPSGTQTITGTVTANTGLSQPLTDTQLRASAVPVSGTFWQTTQPISASSLPLPTGAATESTLSSIDGKIPSLLNSYLPVTLAAQNFPVSTDNVTSVQLASGAEYSGTIEDVKDLQSAQLSINCDQPYRVTITQYRDLAGTEEVSSDILYKGAGEEINENINLPGDYFNVKVKNLGPVATTTFKLSTTFGMMPVTPRVLGTNPNGRTDQALPVRTIPQTIFRTTFAKVLASTWDTNFWVRVFQGTGMANSQSAGNGVITSGTTANQEIILRSVKPFIGSFLLRAQTILSQRIVNNNFFVELVDIIGDNLVITVNSSTSVTVTIPNNPFTSENVGQSMYIGALTGFSGVTAVPNRYAIASVSGNDVTFTVAGWATGADNIGTCSLFGWNYHQLLYDSTTATNVKYDSQRNGWNSGATTATINTTASPGHMAIMGSEDGNAFLADQLVASATSIPITTRASRVVSIADENTPLFLQIRAVNGTTNPASTTTWTIGTISVENYASQQVTIANTKASGSNTGASVKVESLPTLANVTTVGTVTTLSQFLASAAGADATANPTTTGVRGFGMLYNGSTWDRARNNVETTLLASAARTTTQTSADIVTYDAKKLIVVLDMTSVGTGSVTVSIDGKDSASGKYYNILTGSAITTNSTNRYRVGETLASVANSVAQDYLPRIIRIVVTANNANSATYSVGYVLGL